MNTSLASDLERLKKMPYHRLEWSGEVIRKIHRLPKKSRAHPDFQKLLTLHRWLFVPTTLWPINIDGLCHHLLDGIQIGKRLDKKTETLLSLLGNPPEDSVQAVVTQHEVQVQQGHYDSLLQAHQKYNFKEQALLANPDFKAES